MIYFVFHVLTSCVCLCCCALCFLLCCLNFKKIVTYYNQVHEVDEKKPCKDLELSVDIKESSGNCCSDGVIYS